MYEKMKSQAQQKMVVDATGVRCPECNFVRMAIDEITKEYVCGNDRCSLKGKSMKESYLCGNCSASIAPRPSKELVEDCMPFVDAAQRALIELQKNPIRYVAGDDSDVYPECLIKSASYNLIVVQEMLIKLKAYV